MRRDLRRPKFSLSQCGDMHKMGLREKFVIARCAWQVNEEQRRFSALR